MKAVTQQLIELAGSLYRTYKRVNDETRTRIIKTYVIELSVSKEKELEIQDSPALTSSILISKRLKSRLVHPKGATSELFEVLDKVDLMELKKIKRELDSSIKCNSLVSVSVDEPLI